MTTKGKEYLYYFRGKLRVPQPGPEGSLQFSAAYAAIRGGVEDGYAPAPENPHYIWAVQVKGRLYCYDRRGTFKRRLDGEPGSPKFAASWQATHDKAESSLSNPPQNFQTRAGVLEKSAHECAGEKIPHGSGRVVWPR